MVVEEVIGPVPPDWHYTTLGEQCATGGGGIQTGPFGSQLHASDYVPDGIPSIMPQNIGDNRVIEDGIARITELDAARLERYRVQAGDIVYSRRGDVEKRALIRSAQRGWLCGTGCLRVRFGSPAVDPTYASYYLAQPKVRSWIVRHAHGATMPNLNTGILSQLPFVVPPLPEQKAIAHILGTLDDKIELNRRMNETLEGIARALFNSWFVDYDPVHAIAEGRQPVGMDAETATLFPDSFQDSELGLIPAGWKVKGLSETATFLNGLALQKYPPEGEESLPVVKIAQLRAGNTTGADRAGMNVPADYVVHDGDVLFSWSGSLEVELWCGGTGALNQHLFKVTSGTFPKWFYFHATREHLPYFREVAHGKATTMGHIQRHHLKEALVACPPLELLSAINQQFASLMDRQVEASLESRTLMSLRDNLLTKLISGELRVPGAEKLLEGQTN